MLLLTADDLTPEYLQELLFDNPVDEFEIKCVDNWKLVLDGKTTYIPTYLEELIEAQDHSCRIYLQARKGLLMTVSIPVIGQVAAAASVIGIAAHNLATYDPDFEIRKGLTDKVRVTNLKKIERDKIAKKQAS